jgi:WD40 repeat protein
MKMLNHETIAVALNRSFDPIRIFNITPASLEISTPARTLNEHPYTDASPRTVRALLPIDVRSVTSGCRNVLLSSWDDGTIRLQDLRTSSPVDQIYQDNFEVATPINALISYGLERFIAGSAYSHMLKVFDFRWNKGYYHTDSLPCSSNRPYPTPRPPTIVDEPEYHHDQPFCNHRLGRLCRWHALSHHNFYRPNCNIYLPFRKHASSPIYSLAKPSDVSPTIYAGLSGLLVEFTLKSGMHNASMSDTNSLYSRQRGKVAILETGEGSAILDISKCQRVPEIRRQSFSNDQPVGIIARRRHRLDEALQNRHEWQELEPSVS